MQFVQQTDHYDSQLTASCPDGVSKLLIFKYSSLDIPDSQCPSQDKQERLNYRAEVLVSVFPAVGGLLSPRNVIALLYCLVMGLLMLHSSHPALRTLTGPDINHVSLQISGKNPAGRESWGWLSTQGIKKCFKFYELKVS